MLVCLKALEWNILVYYVHWIFFGILVYFKSGILCGRLVYTYVCVFPFWYANWSEKSGIFDPSHWANFKKNMFLYIYDERERDKLCGRAIIKYDLKLLMVWTSWFDWTFNYVYKCHLVLGKWGEISTDGNT
jgi:hypothetical protein